MKIGLVITAHTPYLHFLPACIAAWDAQAEHIDHRVLVLDAVADSDANQLAAAHPEWQIVRGAWSNPNPARNAGWLACPTDWIIGWDADNIPPLDFASKARRAAAKACTSVGALAPAYIDPIKRRILNFAASQHADPRDSFVADTSSVWRREAVLMAGGWLHNQEGYDDWSLAKNLHNQGWQILPLLGVEITLTQHAARRSHTKPVADCLWRARTLGIITLQAGRLSLVDRWIDSLAAQEMPPHWGLTVMLPANRTGLRNHFQNRIKDLQEQIQPPPDRVTFMTPAVPALNTSPAESPEAGFFNTHRTVGGLYAQACAATPEDMILTWEDDVFPHQTTALRALAAEIHPASRTAAISAVYPSRGNSNHAVAAYEVGEWSNIPTLASIPQKPIPVGNIGFGFTLWQRPALEQCPILSGSRSHRQHRLGLDGDLCRRLHAAGWKTKLHGALTCDHITNP